MYILFQHSATETETMNTEKLRENFLLQNLMEADKITLTYTHYDRMIAGTAMPVSAALTLQNEDELKSSYFLERREMGIINVGGTGKVIADGIEYLLEKLDCVYVGKETRDVQFISVDAANPAAYFLLSAPAHQNYPNAMLKKAQATPVKLGDAATGNVRTIYKYIHLNGIKSCQLVMGLTVLQDGSVWNSVPPHTHTRRSEIYFYFDLPAAHTIFHFMGLPQQTRHLAVSNYQAIVSPPWSVHFGCGTMNYSFIWAMAGENQTFEDMDAAPLKSLL